MGIIDWVKTKARRDEDGTVPVPTPPRSAEPVEPTRDVGSSLPGYESKHGTARADRYYHRHLSLDARLRKKARRHMARASRRQNRG
jgi:hypothetical protein